MKNFKTSLLILSLLASTTLLSQIRYYACNRALNAVNTYEEDGTFIEEFITSNSGGLTNPQDIVLHPGGFLLVTGTFNERIKKYDLETGDYLGDWSDNSFALGRPSKMSIGPDNLLYVTQWGQTAATSKIVRFDLEGNYLGPFTPSAPTGLGHVWDESGNFYLAIFGVNTGIGNIRKYNTEGNYTGLHIDSTILENPTYIWWGDNNEMFVQDFTAGKVLRYDANGDYLEDFITGLNQPEGYTFLPNGNLLISERGGNQIIEFNPDGTNIGRWDNGGVLTGVNFIKAIDISGLSVAENQISSNFVNPSIGSQFIFNAQVISQFKSISIYSTSGQYIYDIDIKNTTQWNASKLSNGLYFMIAIDDLGAKNIQKIIIKN
ncbi:MAG: T9SS type A sorting domain-containing protein [Flavobacteriaceae bacterium]|nr:T9SS type A sorting domain-containing protein [Flavobacteriaceae bacterium]